MPRFGRKVCCIFHREEFCHGFLNGTRYCLVNETIEKRYLEYGEIQYGFCALLPAWAKNELLEMLKEQGCTIKKCW